MPSKNGPREAEIERQLVEARMSAKYHGHLEARYERRDRGVRLATLVILFLAAGLTLVTQPASMIALSLGTVLTFVSLVAHWGENAAMHKALRREWMALRYRWERLQRDRLGDRETSLLLEDMLKEREFEELLRERDIVSRREPGRADRRLLQKMLEEVEREMGLDSKPTTADKSARP